MRRPGLSMVAARRASLSGALALAALLGAPPVASAGLAYSDNVEKLSLTSPSGIPMQLAAGPQGSTTVSVNRTGAASRLTGTLGGATANTTWINNTGDADFRLRLTLIQATNIGDCAACSLQLRQGVVVSTQILITAGSVVQSAGAHVTVPSAGSPGSAWNLYALASRTGSADKTATVTYMVEILPATAASPLLAYWNMTMVFLV